MQSLLQRLRANPKDAAAYVARLTDREVLKLYDGLRRKARQSQLYGDKVPVNVMDAFDPLSTTAPKQQHTEGYGTSLEVVSREDGDQYLDTFVGDAERDNSDWDHITSQMARASCAYFAQEYLSGPPEAPYNGRFLISEHHEEWDGLVVNHKRLCVLAPRDHGKCAVFSSLVLSADGTRVKVGEWQGGYVLAYDPSTHKLVPAYAPASRPNGAKRTIKITTRTGRTDTVTENHPFRLWDRWVEAQHLQVGQRIAAPIQYPALGEEPLPPGHAWLLGALVGDGGFTGSSVTWAKQDPLAVGSARVIAAANGWELVPQAKGVDGYWRINGAVGWARKHGLMGCGAYDKRVPDAIFTSPVKDVADFIAGLLDTDAHISKHGGGAVEFYSVAEELMRDVQHLLLRLGVVAVLSRKLGKYKGEDHTSWRLTVRGRSICALAGACMPRGARAPDLAELALAQGDKVEGGSVDLLPKEACSLIQHSEDWFRKRGLPRFNKNYDLTRTKARTIAEAEGSDALRALADGDVLWDEVVSIEDAGIQETYSMHVPGLVNYCANDLVQHNTFFFDFAFPIWKAAHSPNGKGYIFSATREQAARILADIKEELESNPRLQWLVPKRKKNWSALSIKLENGHHIYARGFGTRIRGAHPDWIVVDDGLNDESMYSETVRKKQTDYFYTAITNMIVPDGQILVVGTPFHQADLYADLRKNTEYTFRRYQAMKPDGTVLWTDRYNAERLERRKQEIGTVRFTREFQCEPISDDMSLFPGRLFQGSPTEQFSAVLGASLEYWQQVGIQGVFMGVDFAMSSTVSADYMVVFVIGVDQYQNRWVLDIIREKGLPYNQQLSLINSVARKYNPGLVYLESNQMQRIFGDELIRTTDLPIKKFVTGIQKNSLDKGVPSLRVLLENGKFRIPRGDRQSVDKTDVWIDEMRNFTWHDGKLQGVGTHDDTVMACWITDQAVRQGAFSFDFGDDIDTSDTAYMKELTGETEEEDASEQTVSLMDDDASLPFPVGEGDW